MRTPPGVRPETFGAALDRFAKVVGPEWVFTSEEDLDLYRDAYSPIWGAKDERIASAAVAPDSVEKVQAIVRIANELKIPIYAISTGKNLGYGGCAPVYSGSVVVDLKRMNRILEVDEERAYVVVEPGVSYFDLYRYLRERNIRLWIDCPDPGWGSLLGNALEHGNGYTFNDARDHFNAHCGMEVVLANGEILRTGMGGIPNSIAWHDFRYGFGPYLDGIFSQSNFGVVTKMGFWLAPEPESYRTIVVALPKYADFAPIMNVARLLQNSGIVQGETRILSPLLGPGLKGRWGEEPITPTDPEHAALLKSKSSTYGDLEEYGRKNGLPFWTIEFQCYGPETVTAAQIEYVKQNVSAVPNATIQLGTTLKFPLSDPQAQDVIYKAPVGIPSLAMFTGEGVAGVRGHLLWSVQIPKTGEALFHAHQVFGKAFRDMGVNRRGDFLLPFDWVSRSIGLATAFNITHDAEVDRIGVEVISHLTKVAAENGMGEYRAHAIMQDQVLDAYSFNNHILRRFNETLKDALDPNGILAAGRGGIWPKHLREKRG